jgi:cephalosporin hydroxylase
MPLGPNGGDSEMGSEIIDNEDGLRFTVAGLKFRTLMPDDVNRTTTEDEFVILKSPKFLRKYDDIFKSIPTSNVVEIGIAEGGSLLYFALAFPHLSFVGIDLRHPSQTVLDHIQRLNLQDRVKIYYNTSQTDENRIHEILKFNFGPERIGAIIDDASHMHSLSRRTFEITFDYLANSGVYCLEDWAWAHEPGLAETTLWRDQPSLANLLFELCLLQPSVPGLINSIYVDPAVAFIRRGNYRTAPTVLDIMLRLRGRSIMPI